MIGMQEKPDFSLEVFIERISEPQIGNNSPSDSIYSAICELYTILFFRLEGKYEGIENDSLFDYYELEEIEWLTDQLAYYPQHDAEEGPSLNNIIVQFLMNDDIIASISKVKAVKQKGFVFI